MLKTLPSDAASPSGANQSDHKETACNPDRPKSVLVLGMSSSLEPQEALLMSVDGGGIRGFSQALILEKLEQKIKELELRHRYGTHDYSVPLTEAREIRLCQYFDYIVGTSTGGYVL